MTGSPMYAAQSFYAAASRNRGSGAAAASVHHLVTRFKVCDVFYEFEVELPTILYRCSVTPFKVRMVLFGTTNMYI